MSWQEKLSRHTLTVSSIGDIVAVAERRTTKGKTAAGNDGAWPILSTPTIEGGVLDIQERAELGRHIVYLLNEYLLKDK